MKHLLSLLMLIATLTTIVSCNSNNKETKEVKELAVDQPTFQLYPTQNMWNFIKLNTVNGKMWIVQYSIEKDENRFETVLNEQNLLAQSQKQVKGRFILIPTNNMWNFILLDQIDGKQWQVQWSNDGNSNMVVPIE